MDYNSTDPLDRRKIMESYFPEFLRGNKDFRIFIRLATEEMGLISDYIELFSGLANVDTTPEKFIEDLGAMVGYSYIDTVDPDEQREIIKRWFNKNEARGGEHDLEFMASHAPNQGYLGGDIFVPGTYFPAQESILTFPRDTLFRWDKSKRSGLDRYPDGYAAMDGVIEIIVGYKDKNVAQRVESVKPVGVKLFFKIVVALVGKDGVVVKIKHPQIFTDLNIWISKYVSAHKVSADKENAWSRTSRFIRRSGRVRQEFLISPELSITATSVTMAESVRGLYYNKSNEEILAKFLMIPVQIIKSWKGVARYSVDFRWDGKLGRSGARTMGPEMMLAAYRRMPDLRNTVLTLSHMDNVHTDGSDHFRQAEFEIITGKE